LTLAELRSGMMIA